MELLWSNQQLAARDIAKIIHEYIGWEKNTTYTVIKRLINKGAIAREDPGFLCKALISKQYVQKTETDYLIQKFYGGSISEFLSVYLRNQELSTIDLMEMERIVAELKR